MMTIRCDNIRRDLVWQTDCKCVLCRRPNVAVSGNGHF